MNLRMRIVGALQLGSISAGQLALMLDANQGSIRRELTVLRASGVVAHQPVSGKARSRGQAGTFQLVTPVATKTTLPGASVAARMMHVE